MDAHRHEAMLSESRLHGYLLNQMPEGYYVLQDVNAGSVSNTRMWDFAITNRSLKELLVVIEYKNNLSALKDERSILKFREYAAKARNSLAVLAVPTSNPDGFEFYKYDADSDSFECIGRDISISAASNDLLEQNEKRDAERTIYKIICWGFAAILLALFCIFVFKNLSLETNHLILLGMVGIFLILPFITEFKISKDGLAFKDIFSKGKKEEE